MFTFFSSSVKDGLRLFAGHTRNEKTCKWRYLRKFSDQSAVLGLFGFGVKFQQKKVLRSCVGSLENFS